MHRAPRFLVIALLVPSVAVRGQRPLSVPTTPTSFSAWLHDPRREAAAVLQGTRPLGAKNALLDSALIEEVATALQRIRSAIPDLAGAISDFDASSIRIAIRPAAERRIRRRGIPDRNVPGWWGLPIRRDGTITSIRAVDSLGHRYGATGASLWSDEVTLEFGYYVDVRALIPTFERLPEVEAAWANPEIEHEYVGTQIESRTLATGTWRFLFDEGRGDCPAGCTSTVKTTVDYDRMSHQAALISRDTAGRP